MKDGIFSSGSLAKGSTQANTSMDTAMALSANRRCAALGGSVDRNWNASVPGAISCRMRLCPISQ